MQEVFIDICLSKKFNEDHRQFREKFFTSEGSYGSLALMKKYLFDVKKFTDAIKEGDELVVSLMDPLRESLKLQDKTTVEVAEYIEHLKPEQKEFKILQEILDAHVYEREEGRDLLLDYQSYRQSAKEALSFNDFLRQQLTNNRAIFEQKYPNISKKIPKKTNLKTSVIIGNIFHEPDRSEGEYCLDLNAEGKSDIGFTLLRDEEDHDYDVGSIEAREELFKDRDFSGCSFSNISFFCDLDGTSFRDCVFKDILLGGSSLRDVDLRGAKLTGIIFDAYKQSGIENGVDKFSGLKLSLSNPAFVQKLGVLQLQDTDKNLDPRCKKQIKKIKSKFSGSAETYRAVLKDLSVKATALMPKVHQPSWGLISFISGYLSREKTLEALEQDLGDIIANVEKSIKQSQQGDLEYVRLELKRIKDAYRKLQREYTLAQREKQQEINAVLAFDFGEDLNLDPTYTSDQPERANAVKVFIKATKEDLEKYKAEKKRGESFVDYYRKKHSKEIKQEEIIVPDFRGQDLSNMDLSNLDLSGVIMAGINLTDVNFSKSKLVGASLEGASIDDINFSGANVTDLNLIGAQGKNVNFEKAEGARLRIAGCQFGSSNESERANFKGAKLYALDATLSDIEGALLEDAVLGFADFTNANAMYVDARNAKLRAANFFNAKLSESNFKEADLTAANLEKVKAAHADFTKAHMEKVKASEASFRNAVLNEVIARGGNFTKTDFDGMVAQNADFQASIMEDITAQYTNLEEAILSDVRAARANFTGSMLSGVHAQRIDVRDAIMSKVTARGAHLEEAVMERVKADNADFSKAIMTEIQAQSANFYNSIFEEANLEAADIREANFTAARLKKARLSRAKAEGVTFLHADLDGADVEEMKVDDKTIFLNANLKNLKGDEAAITRLKKLQEEQEKAVLWVKKSKYPPCTTTTKGINDRFICQQAGIATLSTALAAGSSLAGGPLSGAPIGVITALAGGGVLSLVKNLKYKEIGYINNELGDLLAQIGAVGMSMGVGAAEGIAVGVTAELVCAAVGVTTSAKYGALGVASTWSGIQDLININKKKPGLKRTLKKGIGIIKISIGIASLTYAYLTLPSAIPISRGAKIGAAIGALLYVRRAVIDLCGYDENTRQGIKPEDIFSEIKRRPKELVNKFIPTKRKKIIGVGVAVVGAGLGISFSFLLPAAGIATLVSTTTGAVGGLVIGAAGAYYIKGNFEQKVIRTSLLTGIGAVAGFAIGGSAIALGAVHVIVSVKTAVVGSVAGFLVGYLNDDKIAKFFPKVIKERFEESPSEKISEKRESGIKSEIRRSLSQHETRELGAAVKKLKGKGKLRKNTQTYSEREKDKKKEREAQREEVGI